jgi:hypothetical protein
MELKLKIGYPELLELIKQLPASQLEQLKIELMKPPAPKKSAKKSFTDFQKLLLEGPVMNDDQYQQFLLNRQYFNQWRMS